MNSLEKEELVKIIGGVEEIKQLIKYVGSSDIYKTGCMKAVSITDFGRDTEYYDPTSSGDRKARMILV